MFPSLQFNNKQIDMDMDIEQEDEDNDRNVRFDRQKETENLFA